MPRLMIDGTAITAQCKGVGRYALQLCAQLEQRLPSDWSLDVLIWRGEELAAQTLKRSRLIGIPQTRELQLGLVALPAWSSRQKSDVLLLPGERVLRAIRIPVLTVCHDIDELIWKAQGKRDNAWKRIVSMAKTALRVRTLRRSEFVFCNSEFVRECVIARYRVERNKTEVAYCAIDDQFYSDSSASAKSGYVLTFATGDPRENYSLLPGILARIQATGHPVQFTIAGIRHQLPYVGELLRKMHDHGLTEGEHFRLVEFMDQNSRSKLAALYKGADFYLELSGHEGFGMQLAEAMACGTTCISSQGGALAEVGAGFETPLTNLDETAIAEEICAAYRNLLHLRDNAVQVAYTRKYSWDEVGRKVSCVLQSLSLPA